MRGRSHGDRSAIARLVILLLALGVVVTAALSLTAGAADASAYAVLRHWVFGGSAAGPLSLRDQVIIQDIRLPRILMGILVGSGLAISGAVLQGLFRNPLADPGLVGVSAGASLGAVSIIVLGGTSLAPVVAVLGIYALPLFAFLGSLIVTLILYRVATRQGRTSIATMLLAGIALSALAMALTGVLVFVADDRQLRDLTFWQLGSLAGRPGRRSRRLRPSFFWALLRRRSWQEASMHWLLVKRPRRTSAFRSSG